MNKEREKGFVSVETFVQIGKGLRTMIFREATADRLIGDTRGFLLAARRQSFENGRMVLVETGDIFGCHIGFVVRKSQGLAHGYVIVQFCVTEVFHVKQGEKTLWRPINQCTCIKEPIFVDCEDVKNDEV